MKKIITIGLITLVLFTNSSSALVYALEAPTAPTAPSAPEAPTAPEAPSAPEAPTAPEAPSAPSAPGEETEEDNTDNNQDNNNDDNWDEDEEKEEETTTQQAQATNTEESTTENSPTNSQDGKVGDTEIDTGDANTSGTIGNTVNKNVATSPTGTSGSGTTVKNTGNGEDSSNSGTVNDTNNSTTLQDNSATVGNGFEGSATTGTNSASGNVGSSSIETGDANITGTIINDVNTNIAGASVSEFNIIDDHIGDYVLDFAANCVLNCGEGGSTTVANTGNGSGSENTGEVNTIDNNYTFQNNDANLDNVLVLDANTGDNAADRNTGGDSSIKTGDANVAANVVNFVNNNFEGGVLLGVVNIFGDLIGDIILPEDQIKCSDCTTDNYYAANTGNGSDSDNNADITDTTNDSTFQYNDAEINNNILVDANTGDNSTSKNTGGDNSIETGNTDVQVNTLNVANTNIDGGDWWLVIINKAGQWIGQIMGAPEGSMFAGSGGTDFEVDDNGQITASNSGNGESSENNANVNSETNNTVVQNNNAVINNTLDLSANTGGNSASKNTGGNNSIETGDATVIANLINFVNNNISGGRLAVTFVNVFGNWMGDFVTPGQSKNKDNTKQTEVAGNIGGQNPSTNSSNNNSNDSSSNSGSSIQASTVAGAQGENEVSEPEVLAYNTNTGNSAFVNAEDDDKLAAAPITNDGTSTTQGEENNKVLNINLAYAILLLPLMLIGVMLYFITKKFSLHQKLAHLVL